MDFPPSKRLATSNRALEVQRLLRTTVSPDSRNVITQYLNDVERDIRSYEAEINQHKAAIMALESRRNNMKKMAEKYRFLLSPVHRLPPEILASIFGYCCERNVLTPEEPPPAMVLSMVCGRWREILLSTPSLWASIDIITDWWDPDDYSMLDRIAQIFILRSRSQPLTLSLNMEQLLPTFQLVAFVNALISTSSRWKSLQLSLETSTARDFGLDAIRGKLPLLEYLDLQVWVYDDTAFEVFDAFQECPVLHTATFFCQYEFYAHFIFPWHQIRTITFRNTDSQEALSQLSLCRNIRDAKLFCVGDQPHYEGRIVNSIENLHVVAIKQADVSAVYQALTLPHLSSMQLEGRGPTDPIDWTDWDEQPVQDFFVRSSCSLTSLSLKWLRISDEQTISLLQLLPTLQSLSVEEYYFGQTSASTRPNRIVSSTFLNHLSIDHATPSPRGQFLPRLTDLVLTVHPCAPDHAALSNAVATRWLPDREFALEIGVQCLRTLTLKLIGHDSEAARGLFSSFECFRDVGMQISVSYVPVS
ncbi:hypothetical protein Moror_3278 [Moniliophthora roreri MCA 2997]|uniref:F-box domain-containing protein n=2 Tax=Moniliophthora roreri TaxID=221103 RepID=V2WRS6_MONRO|nr:hypothetical protein Moror_3278 [Moniliophthora roreri MCA 2997]